ncbi:hypothetical protein, partial [Pararhodobacter sp.]
MSAIYDLIILGGGAGSSLAVGDIWTASGGELAAIEDSADITAADGTNMAMADTVIIGGVRYTISGIEAIAADVTHGDGLGGTTVTTTKLLVVELTDPSTGNTLRTVMPPDSAGAMPDIQQIEIVTTGVDPSGTAVPLTEIDGDDTVTLDAPSAPDGVVDGTDTGEVMSGGYTDA